MKTDELFWTHVQRALDERRDPREDEALLDLIAAEPERFRELQSLLDSLERLPRLAQRRPLRRVAALVAASITVLIAVAWFTHRSHLTSQPPSTLQERVISFEWEVGTQTPTRSTSLVLNDRGMTAKTEYRDGPLNRTTWTTESTRPKYP